VAAVNVRLRNFIQKLKPSSLESAGKGFALTYLTKRVDFLEELNKGQLRQGVDTQGDLIQMGYSEMHADARSERGLQTDFVDLKFSGDFHKSITADPTLNFVEFDATDSKYPEILELFDRPLLGLTVDNALLVGGMTASNISNKLLTYLTS